MKLAIDYLEPMLERKNDGKEMPTLVIATVEGDIHDIGKNPLVIFDLSRVFATIGRGLQKQSIALFADIVGNHHIKLMDEKKTVVYYLEMIAKRVIADYADEINKNQTLRNDLIKVLEFLRENESTDSQLLLDNM